VIVARLPILSTMPESLLRKMDVPKLLALNEALKGEDKGVKKTEAAKLSSFRDQAIRCPTKVAAGLDDRFKILHAARFLGGAACDAQALWLEARTVLGESGITPLACYDMDAIGMGGAVTAKGWLELHNPGSESLSLKYFYIANSTSSSASAKKVSLADGEQALMVGDGLKEFTELEDFKTALATAVEAMAWAMPWNKSISAIQGFFRSNNFCSKDLSSISKRVALLNNFVEHVFQRNAANWRNSRGFLSADELGKTWSSWFGRHAVAATTGDQDEEKKDSSRQHQPKGRKDDWKTKLFASDICLRFNRREGCQSSSSSCKTKNGKKLRHVCSKVLSNGGFCERSHPLYKH